MTGQRTVPSELRARMVALYFLVANLVGLEHATTLLRQSLRYCVKQEEARARHNAGVSETLTGLLDQHKLAGRKLGSRLLDDAAVLELSKTLRTSSPEQGAGAIAAAIAEGVSADSICEAISLTANELARNVHTHPTMSEALQECFHGLAGHMINF